MSVVSIGSHRQVNNAVREQTRHGGAVTLSIRRPKALLPILVGGIAAAILDLISAFIVYGSGVPRVIAAGLLGLKVLHGGAPIYALGIVLHFLIAISAAAIYYAASHRLYFLTEHAVVCGLFYGVAVFLVMNLIVLPLSALHAKGPFQLAGLIHGLLIHMFCIGLPISFSIRRYSR